LLRGVKMKQTGSSFIRACSARVILNPYLSPSLLLSASHGRPDCDSDTVHTVKIFQNILSYEVVDCVWSQGGSGGGMFVRIQ
jgi:hypothetical protein